MIPVLLVAVPVAVLWVLVTGRLTVGAAMVGLLIGAGLALEMRRMGIRPPRRVAPGQVLGVAQYLGHIVWGGLRSSLQVARLVLRPRLHLHTGIVALRGDGSPAAARLAALSAHGINMSPGQLVVDFAEDGTLFVHLIDIDAARPGLEAEQATRLALLRRILGEGTDTGREQASG